MSTGTRNRVMKWTGTAMPFKPEKRDLKEATRQVGAILDGGGVLAIAGEGRIHAGEGELLQLSDGTAFFALRSGVPIVPVAINGTSWLVFGAADPGPDRGAHRRRRPADAGRPSTPSPAGRGPRCTPWSATTRTRCPRQRAAPGIA